MCPFCYIGKRRFEKALDSFLHKENIVVEWKSFLLNPALQTNTAMNPNDYLVQQKGMSADEARQANEYVTTMAAQEGLEYHLDKAVLANTQRAHRLLQAAKEEAKGSEMEEILFRAYFTEGKNIDDVQVLTALGEKAGINSITISAALNQQEYQQKVEADIYEAQQIGVRGVPYFVIDDKYAVSGAQATATFLGALNKAWEERNATP